MDENLIGTADLSRALAEIADGEIPGYRQLADRQRDGRWPVTRVRNRPYVRREDLPLVAAALGLTVRPEIARKLKRSTPKPAAPAAKPVTTRRAGAGR